VTGAPASRSPALLLACAALATGCGRCGGEPLHMTHGVAMGDLTATQVVFWARASGASVMHVTVSGPERTVHLTTPVEAEHDYAGVIPVDRLTPGTTYRWEVWFAADADDARPRTRHQRGTVHTPPPAGQPWPVTFAFSGDLGGQNVCRDARAGYPIFAQLASLSLDFFVALGDMIYADGLCEETGHYGNRQVPGNFDRSSTLDGFWAHWKYNRDDPGYRELLGDVPVYPVWDDHEVLNDFGPHGDVPTAPPYPPGEHLMPLGLRAFLDYNPVDPRAGTRLYRRVRHGKHLELFLLDNRQYRDANTAADDGPVAKTMLGAAQRDWLIDGLAHSDATWKIVVTSVPMSVPTGDAARDGWANFDQDTGYERELLAILDATRRAGVRNQVWITTDVHFAEVFRYTPFPEQPGFHVHEFAVGPLNAAVLPKYDFDATLAPECLFFYGPRASAALTDWHEAVGWMNFGVIDIDAAGVLRFRVVTGTGATVYTLALAPE